MAKKVYLGVGHGGSDPGAVANGFKEKDLNLSIALAAKAELERHKVTVMISRTKDIDKEVTERIVECNKFNPDLAVDVHNNAGGGDGAEVYYTIGGGVGQTLAANILAEMVKIGQNSRGTKVKVSGKVDYFGFIREINCPSVIAECAFVDNKTDIKIIDTKAEQEKMGVAIAKGILTTLGIKYKAETTKKPTSKDVKPVVTYRVRTNGNWLPAVTDLKDYAGIIGSPITDIAIKVSTGKVKYRVHIKGGKWLDYVTGYDLNNHKNGYAGDKKVIDAIEIRYTKASGAKNRKAKYRISPVKANYWPWQTNADKNSNMDGYAGSFGTLMDRVQIVIE